jgi:hypothetical protein
VPSANKVVPGKWTNIRILFDNGTYSVIAGEYDEDFCLGERWNGEKGKLGFPNVFGEPIWHVVPEFLRVYVLHGVLAELSRHFPTNSAQLSATLQVLGELSTAQDDA